MLILKFLNVLEIIVSLINSPLITITRAIIFKCIGKKIRHGIESLTQLNIAPEGIDSNVKNKIGKITR